jgi:hypothetical protein
MDESAQVYAQHGGYLVGLLGVLNGICGTYAAGPHKGCGPIAAKFAAQKADESFPKLEYFVRTDLHSKHVPPKPGRPKKRKAVR